LLLQFRTWFEEPGEATQDSHARDDAQYLPARPHRLVPFTKTQPPAFRSARQAAEKRRRMKLRILGGFLSFLLPAPDVLS
jgi:hypothetical protein